MRTMKVAATVCLLILSIAAARGASVSYGPTSAIPDTKTDWTSALDFPKFDSTLGVLNTVELSITGEIKTTLTVTNNASSASDGNAKTHVTITVRDPLTLLTVMPDIYSPPFGYTLPPNTSTTSGLLTKSETKDGSWTAAAILTEFTGTGNISLSAVTFTETVLVNNGGNTFASQVTDANATGLVTYYYTPVPEPSGIMALLTGVGGLLGMAFRRRR